MVPFKKFLVLVSILTPVATHAESLLVRDIQATTNEFSLIKEQAALQELKDQLEEKKNNAQERKAKKSKSQIEGGEESTSGKVDPLPAPAIPPMAFDAGLLPPPAIETQVGAGVKLISIRGIGDRLVAVARVTGAGEMILKKGSKLPSGEIVTNITPSGVDLKRPAIKKTRDNPGAPAKTGTVIFGEGTPELYAAPAPQLPPAPGGAGSNRGAFLPALPQR